jgi:CheY-like chemotaxis protein
LPSTIAIKQQIATATKTIHANPTQVHQILINLCTNAFHAMEQTGGTLEVTLKDCELSRNDLQQHPEIEPGSFVVLSISDTGTGVDPDIWGRIFDPYFTTKGVGKGTGMGLSIVHGIVTGYGGFITGESNHGNGTIFHVFFPATEEEVGHDAYLAETALPGTERILLVDDEEILVEMGKAMLEQLGYAVTARTSSLEALTTFQNQPNEFDVVITDQTMPSMTGVNLAQQMLKIRPGLPIILCTGYSNLINKEQAKNYGIKGFAMKPFSKKKIAVLLRQVLDKKLPS